LGRGDGDLDSVGRGFGMTTAEKWLPVDSEASDVEDHAEKEIGCHRARSRSEQALSSKAVQQIIAGFIVDFYCHPAHLVIEADGEVHQSTARYDQERDGVLESHGFRILRLRNETILNDLPSALAEIRDAAGNGLVGRGSPFPIGKGDKGLGRKVDRGVR